MVDKVKKNVNNLHGVNSKVKTYMHVILKIQ